jgi:hypothetical protein
VITGVVRLAGVEFTNRFSRLRMISRVVPLLASLVDGVVLDGKNLIEVAEAESGIGEGLAGWPPPPREKCPNFAAEALGWVLRFVRQGSSPKRTQISLYVASLWRYTQ